MITLSYAAKHYKIPPETLKAAVTRYRRTNGKRGLFAKKRPDIGSNVLWTTHKAVQRFVDREYKPRGKYNLTGKYAKA